VRRKTANDIAAIKEVQRAAEAALDRVLRYLRDAAEPTSEVVHAFIDAELEARGCESPEGHIASSGPQSAEPHERGKGPIARGVPIVIDLYPRSKASGFFADMTRTVCLGEPPAELQYRYDTVRRAQDAAISMVRPGTKCTDLQQAVEDLFVLAGFKTSGRGKEFPFAEGFVHGLGHGVGQGIHEAPRIGRGSPDVLEEGDVITLEPGLYYPHLGGVRLEDLVVVTHDGCRNLTDFPKELRV
jgi:Xaa-Pro aminopeptidase